MSADYLKLFPVRLCDVRNISLYIFFDCVIILADDQLSLLAADTELHDVRLQA